MKVRLIDDDSIVEVENYIAAYIDLLGQKEQIRCFKQISEVRDEVNELQITKMINDTYGAIRRLRNDWLYFFNSLRENRIEFNLPPKKQLELKELRKVNIKEQWLSDCIVGYHSLDRNNIKVKMNGIFTMIAACGYLCILGLISGEPVRGGVEIGWGVEMKEGELYGSAILNAHYLEKRKAQYPRVVIGDSLFQYINRVKYSEPKDTYDGFNIKLANLCSEMLIKDFDDCIIIDYLGEGFKKSVAGTLTQIEIKAAYTFVRGCLVSYREQKNIKLASRYKTLCDYFESKLHLWGVDPITE